MASIEDFYKGKSILITGATGFLGQPLVEKILWTAPDVKRIYLLIRPKVRLRGRVQTPQERIEKELFESSVFDRLYGRYGNDTSDFLREKLQAVSGDISQDDLGLEPEVRDRLLDELDVVINSAAVVSFDAPLDEALEMNIFGARRLLRFALSCRKAILCHVSTAYVCGSVHDEIPETLYHSATDSKEEFPKRGFKDIDDDIAKIRKLISKVRERAHSREVDRQLKLELLGRRRSKRRSPNARRRDVLERLRRQWLREQMVAEGMRWARRRGWNDTYTYTKALGEQLVCRERGTLPMVIMRPSVIESSLSEPSPGWLDGLRMADPLIVAIGKGRLNTLPLNPGVVLDLVPVDMVVNATLAAIPSCLKESEVGIFQVATSARNPMVLGKLYELIYQYFETNPMLDKSGHPIRVKPVKFQTRERFRFGYKLRTARLDTAEKTLQRLPILDRSKKIKRRLSARRIAHEKLYYYGEIYEPYLNLNCRFVVDRTMELFHSLSEEQQRVFNFDVSRINWRYYIQNVHIPGVKKFILKIEGQGTLEVADPKEKEPLKELTIPHLLERAAAKNPDKTAVQIKRKGVWERFSYVDMQQAAHEIADRFRLYGFEKGDRVVLFSENQPEWGMAYLGACFAGLVVVPIDAQTWHREAWSLAQFTASKAILASEACLARLQQSGFEENEEAADPIQLLNVDQRCRCFGIPEFSRSTCLAETDRPKPKAKVEEDDLASIIFTSGTMSDPRGAMHTHANFINNLLGVNHYLPIYDSDNLLCVLPLYHALAFTCGFLMPIYGAATATYASSIKPRLLLEDMRETGVTTLLGVPTLFAMVRDYIDRRVLKASSSKVKSRVIRTSKKVSRSVDQHLGTNLGKRLFAKIHQEFGGKIRMVVSGGSALGGELYDEYKAMGFSVYEGYGLTETAPVLTVSPLQRSRRTSAGKALPGVELRLFNPDEHGVGEIIVQTPSLMEAYYGNTDATENVIRDQWFHTGDLGWVDADGYVYITGRIKDVIVTGAGKNVYPADLEAIYKELPSVEDICVTGLKRGLTEEIHALIVPDPPDAPEQIVKREVQKRARELPSYFRLQSIHLDPGPLPRDSQSRLRRDLIRGRLLEKLNRRIERLAAPEASEELAPSNSSRDVQVLHELSRISGAPVEDIHPETDLYSDLGMDSLMAIELLLFLDNRFGVSVPDERASQLQTVGELLEELSHGSLEEASVEAVNGVSPVPSSLPYDQRPALDRFFLGLTISSLRALYRFYFELKLYGPESLLTEGKPFIIAANHSSHLDLGAILSAFKAARGAHAAKKLHIVGARDYFFDNQLKSWFFSSFLNVIPLEREETSLAGLRMVRSILSTGEPVLIFPEGTRSRTGSIQGFKAGVGLIALELDVPIIPAYISGTYESMPVGRLIPRRRQVEVYFGRPILMDAYRGNGESRAGEVYRRIAGDVRKAVEELAERVGQRR